MLSSSLINMGKMKQTKKKEFSLFNTPLKNIQMENLSHYALASRVLSTT